MIALIDLVHSYPLYHALSSTEEISRGSPQKNLKLVLDGNAECGMVSLIDYFKNRDSLNLISGPNIHSRGRTISTIVVSRGESLHHGSRIAVTSQTETTSFYLGQILKIEFPQSEMIRCSYNSAKELLEEEQFALVIGDEALKAYSGDYRIIMDIGLHYSRLTSYYPVYSVMVSRDKISDDRIGTINKASSNSSKHIEESILEGEERGFSRELLVSYYRAISYTYDDIIRRSIDYTYMNYKKRIL